MQEEINYSKKQLITSIAVLVASLLVILVVAAVTSIIWIPALIICAPFLVILALLIKFTQVGKPFQQIYYNLYDWLFYKSERPRKFLWSFIYNTMCMMYPQTQWKAMNYGYSVLSDQGSLIKNLKPEDEEERFCLQLYHYVATQFNSVKNLQGLKILEVGSGRGGGLSYISNYLSPVNCIGVDFSENQVRFCKSHYAANEKIQFFQGDSEHLDLIPEVEANQFDVVVNVESSHCYGSFEAFVNQVNRALKPGGVFCFTDFRTLQEANELKAYLEGLPFFTVTKYEDITINVIQSLKQDEKRRSSLIEGNVSKMLKPFFRKFSGLQGTRIYEEFQEKKTLYVAYILQKK